MTSTEDNPYVVELVWEDRVETVTVPPGLSILDAAEGEGLFLPFGCRNAACGTCTGQILEGEVEYSHPPRALKPRHRDRGYVLLCVARPVSDCRIRVGSRIQPEMTGHPFE